MMVMMNNFPTVAGNSSSSSSSTSSHLGPVLPNLLPNQETVVVVTTTTEEKSRTLQILRFAIDGLPSAGISSLLNSFYAHYTQDNTVAFGLEIGSSSSSSSSSHHQQVLAHPPSSSYKVQIFVRPSTTTTTRQAAAAPFPLTTLPLQHPLPITSAYYANIVAHLDIQLRDLHQHLLQEATFVTSHPHLCSHTHCVIIVYERSPFYYLHLYLPYLFTRLVPVAMYINHIN